MPGPSSLIVPYNSHLSRTLQVHYMENDELAGCRKVDEGEILIVQPRHPRNLYAGEQSGECEDGWGEDQADALTGVLVK